MLRSKDGRRARLGPAPPLSLKLLTGRAYASMTMPEFPLEMGAIQVIIPDDRIQRVAHGRSTQERRFYWVF